MPARHAGGRTSTSRRSGSCPSDIYGELVAESARRYNESIVTAVTLRTFNQVSRFLDGLELVEPGIVQCHGWHPEPGASVDDYEVAGGGAVGWKP